MILAMLMAVSQPAPYPKPKPPVSAPSKVKFKKMPDGRIVIDTPICGGKK